MNRLSTIFGSLAVIAIAIVFVVSFQPGGGTNQAKSGPDCAAEVSGKCLRSNHYWAAFRLLAPRGVNDAELKRIRLRQMTLDGLIERDLLVADAKRLGISVSEEELTRELASGRLRVSLPAASAHLIGYHLGLAGGSMRYANFNDRKTNTFSPKNYREQVTELTRLSESDFREFERQEMIAARVRDLVKSRVLISESEARIQFEREKNQVVVSYVKFDAPFIQKHVLDLSDAAVTAYADKNKEDIDKAFDSVRAQYKDECRVTRHILVRVNPESTTPDEDKKKAQEKIEAAKKKIDGGASFESVARTTSDDVTAVMGGSLGCVRRGQMVKAFEDALFGLDKEGAVSGVVETQYGMHLVQLVKVAKGIDAEAAGRLDKAREIYAIKETERLASEAAKEVIEAVKGGATIDDAVKAYLAKAVKKSEPAGDKPAGDKPAGDKPAGDKPAEENKNEHEGEEPELPMVETSLPFNQLGSPFDAAQGVDPAGIAFALQKPGDVAPAPIQVPSGYAVMVLKELTKATDEQWKDDRELYFANLRQQKQQEALAAYVRRLRVAANATIKVNPEFSDTPPSASGSPSAGAPPQPPPPPVEP